MASEFGVLFELPEYDKAFGSFAFSAMHDLAIAGDPILSKIRRERSPGALGSVFLDKDGEEVELESRAIGADFSVLKSEVIEGDIWKLAMVLTKGSKGIEEGHKKMFFETLQKVTEATGNVVDSAGPLTFEKFYEVVSRIERSLTDDDQLAPLNIVMSPELMRNLPEQTPDQIQKIADLEQRQLEELLAKRRRRRLS